MSAHEAAQRVAGEVRDQAWMCATARLAEDGIEPAATPEQAELVRRCVEIGIDAGMHALAHRYAARFMKGDAHGEQR
ncbi:hypothetical protein [Tenggerimyces flavus]|uniref:Uncharacterized protein n=1 Tax=Tenggerimyces flavus TaxID=1708749 RepID=A0ABV7Y9P0_9ACTN|nr:hypothetical protein [Tenggerimyces flavus]MBM7788876.1 hypothetical protein [Tenggerimyces flavus]